ncbi:hypothetical protein D1007_49829 [Hordeum vulgare]|nr:hypothetical protein D1007_49829 [Hordeum vulgare]
MILNEKGLDKVWWMTASASNGHGVAKIWLASCPTTLQGGTMFTFFLYSVFAGMVPPISDFFDVVLNHYQVHTLHLHTSSVLLLSIFTYPCEAFLGVMSFVAFLWKFFRLRLTAADQCSACMSFQMVTGWRAHIINKRLPEEVDGFREHWSTWTSASIALFSKFPRR